MFPQKGKLVLRRVVTWWLIKTFVYRFVHLLGRIDRPMTELSLDGNPVSDSIESRDRSHYIIRVLLPVEDAPQDAELPKFEKDK